MVKNDFICPQCQGHLQPADNIIFTIKTRDGRKGLLLLSPQLGEYTIIKHHSFKLRQGEHLDFFCPLCHESLSSFEEHINLAKIYMIGHEGKRSEIAFSKIVGEECTYKIQDDKAEGYGPDSPEYKNYWGEGPTY